MQGEFPFQMESFEALGFLSVALSSVGAENRISKDSKKACGIWCGHGSKNARGTQTAVTKCLCHLFLTVLETRKSRVKVLAHRQPFSR